MQAMLTPTTAGLFCSAGQFHIDPVVPVPLAIVTHAHRDHLVEGVGRTICETSCAYLLRQRLPSDSVIDAVPYGQVLDLGHVSVTLHPAGHVLGSAQVRIARSHTSLSGEQDVWVVSGDYKTDADPTCAPLTVLPCNVFVTESTFALPIYRWPAPDAVVTDMLAWIAENQRERRPSVLGAYALGKAQRLVMHLAPHLDTPILVHGAVAAVCQTYREAGVPLPEVVHVDDTIRGAVTAGRIVIAPPSALGTPWMKRFPRASTALVSGWMRVRGRRRWKGVDRGFVLSDHADWPGLLSTIAATGARRVLTCHGHAHVLARHLRDLGLDASPLPLPSDGAPSDANVSSDAPVLDGED